MIPKPQSLHSYLVYDCDNPRELRARLTVLYDKQFRIASYNTTLCRDTLDAKQVAIMHEFRRKVGRDKFPKKVRETLARTVLDLERKLRDLEQVAA